MAEITIGSRIRVAVFILPDGGVMGDGQKVNQQERPY
jgi:hypothetical protein